MKIAVPTKEHFVNDHLGDCDAYSIFTINEMGKIVNSEILPAAEDCASKLNIAEVLHEQGVKVLLAGTMIEAVYHQLTHAGIRVYCGCSGEAVKLAEDYIQGKVIDKGEGCHHHEHAEEQQRSH